MTRLEGSAREEWRAHGSVAFAACIGMAGGSILSYSIGLFIEPLQREFGWSRVQIMAGPGITALVCMLLAPIVGRQIDRIGPRPIAIVGVSAVGILVASLSLAGPSVWSWLCLWLLLAVAFSLTLPNVWTAAVSRTFSAGRGLAMGVVLSGSGISSLILPLIAYSLIQHAGWRIAFIGLGSILLLIVLPVLVLFFSSAQDGVGPGKGTQQRDRATAKGNWRIHLVSRRFIQLAIAAFLAALVVPPLVISLVPVLVANGLSRVSAASTASMVGIASVAGRISIGLILDRVDGRIVAACTICIPVIACALLIAMPTSVPAATVAVLCLGLALGAEADLVAYLTSRYFSLEAFGTLFGMITGLTALAGAGGPLLLSAVFDSLDSYTPFLWAVMPLCPIAALLFLTLGPYPDRLAKAA